ncbi:MAG: hypothetical protein Q9M39_09275 [Sulfurovum sp.]|nr:hypothetical protein [Sulfurovum sp.]
MIYRSKSLSRVLLLMLILGSNALYAKVILIPFGDMVIPIVVMDDVTAPTTPVLSSSIVSSTYDAQVSIEITGEVSSRVYINGVYILSIDATGKANLLLDTSGNDGIKTFNITLEDGAGNSSPALTLSITKETDPIYTFHYKGLYFYYQDQLVEDYTLTPLSDSTFNALTQDQKEKIAEKLLGTLFYSFPYPILKEKIATGNFIENILISLGEERNDKTAIEDYIIDNDYFRQVSYNEQEAVNILTRFFVMPELDHYYLQNWMAYILTQTIMFSPAYELESSQTPNISRVYNRLVRLLAEESGLRYMTYVHMISEDNWRRFRSPEDNGREMLEIFTFDKNDLHVPIAAQALKNWKLDSRSDTLVVGLNENREPLSLFDTTIYNGDDFYRELAKSDVFIAGVTKRLVSFFFPNTLASEQVQITQSILQSNPETWKDILLQIVLSEEYLLHSQRVKSAEELFFSTTKKLFFKHHTTTIHQFKDRLEEMHQATMKYKLGKLHRVPLDTLSFANYHQYIREDLFLRQSNPDYIDIYTSWSRQGWSREYLANNNFILDSNDEEASLLTMIQYIFHSMIHRDATLIELALFKDHMLVLDSNPKVLRYTFDIFRTYADPVLELKRQEDNKRNIAIIVLDYLSRLTETYTFGKVN